MRWKMNDGDAFDEYLLHRGQNRASLDRVRVVRDWIGNHCPRQQIGSRGSIEWASSAPDLDFLKPVVFKTQSD